MNNHHPADVSTESRDQPKKGFSNGVNTFFNEVRSAGWASSRVNAHRYRLSAGAHRANESGEPESRAPLHQFGEKSLQAGYICFFQLARELSCRKLQILAEHNPATEGVRPSLLR
jgi:hypothetical protein